MRAHWLRDLTVQDHYILKDESLHHLVNVIRISQGDSLLLLNGKGLLIETQVESISKKELKLKFLQQKSASRNYLFDLALGMPKREALEMCLKAATELGFRRIYLIRSDYSQMKAPETDRIQSLLVSALEQSNASYLPEVLESKWEALPWNEYPEILLLDSQNPSRHQGLDSTATAPKLLIVGPEGGFSPLEIKNFATHSMIKVVNLPTPILRTPTALATGAGIMLESLLNRSLQS